MTVSGTTSPRPVGDDETEPLYVPGAVPYGTVTCSQSGWFVCSVERCEPSQGMSASGTAFPSTET